jgi:hypothetical protein
VKLESSYEVERKDTNVTIICPTCDRLFLFVDPGGNCVTESRSFHRTCVFICVCVDNTYLCLETYNLILPIIFSPPSGVRATSIAPTPGTWLRISFGAYNLSHIFPVLCFPVYLHA